MESKHKKQKMSICHSITSDYISGLSFAALPPAHAVGPIALTVVGPDGTSYPISDITTLIQPSGGADTYNKGRITLCR